MTALLPPDLGLYVHVPWCVRKCPYCDFNSHALKTGQIVPEEAYVTTLLADLEGELALVQGRRLSSIFFGGGTPSLLSPEAIARIITALSNQIGLTERCEITLEANPGTLDQSKAVGFQQAGINRISIGGQSFSPTQLQKLGRIHTPEQTRQAAVVVNDAGLSSWNLDLMYALPDQHPDQALEDLRQALLLAPPHLSLYQLTLEPGTPFHHTPPALPGEDAVAQRYEVSAFATPGQRCQHNLNYWQFGDYLGIGPGAHGKITTPSGVIRRVKQRHPKQWLASTSDHNFLQSETLLSSSDLIFEFMLNALRLTAGVPLQLFEERTGLPLSTITATVESAIEDALLTESTERLETTPLGQRFLNDLTARFLPIAA